jgi:radical SAM-linked protein
MRVRIKFEKRGPVRFTSHRNVIRIMQRGMAAAGVPVSFTRGYHPHMRMSFGPPLKTGWEGFDEYLDVHIDGSVDDLARRVNAFLPQGLRLIAFSPVVTHVPKLANDISAARFEVRVRAQELAGWMGPGRGGTAGFEEQIESHFGGRSEAGDSQPRVVWVSVENGADDLRIEYTSTVRSGRVVAPKDVVAILGDPDTLATPPRVARKAQYVARDGEYISPINEAVIQGIK